MAKNKVYSQINQYANREEEIRKAKGNPNKNNHAKKKNSNYGGYSTSAGSYMAQKLAERLGIDLPRPASTAQLLVQRGKEHGYEKGRRSVGVIELLTVAETAALLKTTKQQVRKMIAQQLIPAMKIGREWRVSRQYLEDFLRSGME